MTPIASLLAGPPAYIVLAVLAIAGACLSTAMIVFLFTRWHYLDRCTVALHVEQLGRALYAERLWQSTQRRIVDEETMRALVRRHTVRLVVHDGVCTAPGTVGN